MVKFSHEISAGQWLAREVAAIGKNESPTAERIAARRIRRAGAKALAAELSGYFPASFHGHGVYAFWIDGSGIVNNARVLTYSDPNSKCFPPWVFRFSVNISDAMVSDGMLDTLGVERDGRRRWRNLGARRGSHSLELSVLPDELETFVPWVVAWIVHNDQGRPLPLPPNTLDGDWMGHGYLWSTAAARRYDAYCWRLKAWKAAFNARRATA